MKFKRGDTFFFQGLLPAEFPVADWTAVCHVQDAAGTRYPVGATLTLDAGRYTLTLRAEPVDTGTWPVGKMVGDVQFTNAAEAPAFVVSTKDFKFDVIADRAMVVAP